MKLKFKPYDYQTDAVAAVADLFRGQEKRQDTFTITNERQLNLDAGLGVSNALTIGGAQIAANMNDVQRRHSLPLTTLSDRPAYTEVGMFAHDAIEKTGGTFGEPLPHCKYQFCVEMETGTGKTYVYTKTMFELNKQYGFTKFIVVVPSVAIREGVYKSFQITAEHFAAQYGNAPARCFIYDSKKLSQVRLFATSSDIEIMIINIDAFKKAENVINQEQDRLNGETAMSYIQDTHPIVIIDEPQSVDNTPKAKEAIASLNPLCVFRYSATHREKINLLYRLTPVDAYQMGLVKQICVSSNQVENDFNRPYVRLVSVSHENGFWARLEIDTLKGTGKTAKSGKAERKAINVKPGANLYAISGGRDLYEGYTVAGIDCQLGFECIEFGNGETLYLGKAFGDVDASLIKRVQIRRTVEAHLGKELRYLEKGIKVLSLFFIDEVAKYRAADGGKGIYAEMFEECYGELIALPKFAPLRERFMSDVAAIHNGYFSRDKKGNPKNTKGDTADDCDTYATIMKDKEWLLSFGCPLRFIFSHSALKEGWDNPNVFQVCTLIEQKSTFTCRQKVGRGLRLCVDQDGNRIEDRNINVLHVMANESFAEFAETLQREIEQETGVKFGILQISLFSGLTFTETVTEEKKVTDDEAKAIADYVASVVAPPRESTEAPAAPAMSPELAPVAEKAVAAAQMGATITPYDVAEMTYGVTYVAERTVSYGDAQELLNHFEQKGYVTKSGAIKDAMKVALAAGTLDLPKKFEGARQKFETVIAKANTRPPVHDAAKEVRVKLKKKVLISPDFLALWEKIKGRTVYRVQFDEQLLIDRCVEELSRSERVGRAKIVSRTARVNVEQSGVSHAETELRTADADDESLRLPDFLRTVDNECFLSRRTAAKILIQSGRARDFLNNPQRMSEVFIEAVRHVQGGMEIDGIRYMRLDGEEYYLQEIFDSEELIAFLDRNAIAVGRSVYDHIIYDSSTVERPFAVALDSDPDVRMFFKIPARFKIETPIGSYTPDWAVFMDKDGEQRLYFVLETKGTTRIGDLRTPEQQKIRCGRRHFAALSNGVELRVARDWREFKAGL
jgi:type III restriction enzyme